MTVWMFSYFFPSQASVCKLMCLYLSDMFCIPQRSCRVTYIYELFII